MITFEQLRSILFSSDAPAGLDSLVRTELSVGRTTRAVYDEMLAQLESLRAIPGYSDDHEDALGNIFDGLTGWCHPDLAYRDHVMVANPSVNGHSTTTPTRPAPQA